MPRRSADPQNSSDYIVSGRQVGILYDFVWDRGALVDSGIPDVRDLGLSLLVIGLRELRFGP